MIKNTAPRILIADPWKPWCDLFKDLLPEDSQVVCVSTVQDARRQIHASNSFFHVVIIDIQLTEDPTHDLDLGHHALLDELNNLTSYTRPILVISSGSTTRQARKVAENYHLEFRDCVDKYPKDNESFDYVSFAKIVAEAVDMAMKREKQIFTQFSYERLNTIAQTAFGVFPIFSGKLNPQVCLALLPDLETHKPVWNQIETSIELLQEHHPSIECRCIPFGVSRKKRQVWTAINESGLIIADVTGENPNVFYELGLCDALKKPMLLLVHEGQEIPPHLNHFPSIKYSSDRWRIRQLAIELRRRLGDITNNPLPAYGLGESRWSLNDISTQTALALFPEVQNSKASPSDNMSEKPPNIYEAFIRSILERKGYHPDRFEVHTVFDTRYKAQSAWRAIQQAGVILADLSTAEPEILYMLGLAHAQNRPVIFLTPGRENLPHDLKELDYFEYSNDWYDWEDSTIQQKEDELIKKIDRIHDVYEEMKQLSHSAYSAAQITELNKSPSVPEKDPAMTSAGNFEIPEGVIGDILRGLDDSLLFANSDLFKELSELREDRRIHFAVEKWNELWLEEPGLPYLTLIKLLATQEFAAEMYSEYRDHVAHSLWVYLLGLYLYAHSRPIRNSIDALFLKEEFLKAWKIAALFHDIGYTGDKGIDQEETFLQPLIRDLQSFIDYPLCAYLEARGLNLSKQDEDGLARISRRFRPAVITLDSLELMPLPGLERKLLDTIENLSIPTQLAQEKHKTPLQSYYQLGKTVKPKPDNRERFRDHGILSTLILLHQFYYFDHCLDILRGKELPPGISRESKEMLISIIAEPVTQDYREAVHQAAAAIALHNVDIEIWDVEKAKQPPYFLSLDDYKIALEQSPLAFLLALTDVLQCWERPKRRHVSNTKDFSARSQDVRIICEGDMIIWSVRPDEDAGKQLVSPSQEIKTMSKYMSYCGKRDLSALIVEREWSE